jgi:hypothetical protein
LTEIKQLNKTWREMQSDKSGTVYVFEKHAENAVLVMRGNLCLCGYVGVPVHSFKAGIASSDVPLECHWGCTYSSEGKGNYPEGYWWYGWDYAHLDDRVFDDRLGAWGGRDWHPNEVYIDCLDCLKQVIEWTPELLQGRETEADARVRFKKTHDKMMREYYGHFVDDWDGMSEDERKAKWGANYSKTCHDLWMQEKTAIEEAERIIRNSATS